MTQAIEKNTPKLSRVIRLDSLPVNSTYFTEEGYLVDHPILTSIGIFEYTNNDGSVRRELRLPEEVFKPESLKSYKGKPIIVTHDAGLITKDNVGDEAIGTILSEGYQDGDDVRAEIIIHNTDEMKSAGLKELSLGYNLTLDETPGVWEGKPYDAIQRDITINHLALVFQARAGDQARLNIDSRDRTTKGVKTTMSKKIKKFGSRADGVLSPEELQKAIADYKKRRAERIEGQKDDDAAPPADDDTTKTTAEADGDDDAPTGDDDQKNAVQAVKDRRDRRDEDGDPKDKDAAMGVIAQQDADMDILFDIIDTLLAERDMKAATDGDNCDPNDTNTDDDDEDNKPASALAAVNGDDDGEDDETNTDEDDEEEDVNTDDDDDDIPTTNESAVSETAVKEPSANMDSIDAIVRQRVQLGIAGSKLGIKGLENMKLSKAKKTVIRAVNPGIRLDGKSDAYINGAFSCAMAAINTPAKKGVAYQKKQMFNGDSCDFSRSTTKMTSADAARARMIERRMNKEVK